MCDYDHRTVKAESCTFYRDVCLYEMWNRLQPFQFIPNFLLMCWFRFFHYLYIHRLPIPALSKLQDFLLTLAKLTVLCISSILLGKNARKIYTPLPWDVSWWSISRQCPRTPLTCSVIRRHYLKCSALHAIICSQFLNYINLWPSLFHSFSQ